MLKRLAFSLVALAACTPPAAPPSAPAVQLYAMACGSITFPDVDIFADDNSMRGVGRELVNPCFLIRHPNGDLIWDAGFPDAINAMPNGLEIASMGARVLMPTTLASQLAQIGVAPADVDFISFSHSHTDHVGNAALFTNATWIVDPDERAYMFRDEARADAESFPLVAHLETQQPRLIDQPRLDVFGDGSVVIIQTPGHTPGHTVLLVRLPNAGAVLLTGDMFHLAESRERRLVPRFNVDRPQTLDSMALIETIAAEENARVVRQHVPEDYAALPRFPEALN